MAKINIKVDNMNKHEQIRKALEYDRTVAGILNFLEENEDCIKEEDGIRMSHKAYKEAVKDAMTQYIK